MPIQPEIKFNIGSINPVHVINLLKSVPSKNSPDIEGLSIKLLKHNLLSHIFNLSLQSGTFPEKFKLSCTVPVFKSGNKADVDNYRPISLVCTLSKLIEKMVAKNLINYLHINKLIHPQQFGFQRNLSTEHNLVHVNNFISNALNNNEICIGVFFYLRKAFNVVDHKILIAKLNKLGVKNNALNWIESYLSHR